MALSREQEAMFSALGAGKPKELSELMQAPEEEEDFDILNDETFGDLGDANYDWEDQHKRMAEAMDGSAFFTEDTRLPDAGAGGDSLLGDSGFVTMDRGHPSTTEEELERSIRQLVVEDQDKGFTPMGKPIPGAQQRSHLDELFGPNSPPGILELETLGSPAGHNIWGSPSADAPLQKPVNTLQALFASAKQAARRDFPQVFTEAAGPVPVPMGPAPPLPVPSEAHTLAEIEHNMLARDHHKPRVMTAQELERQLRGEPPADLPPPSMAGPPPPPVPAAPGTAVAFRAQPGPPPGLPPHHGSAPISIAARPALPPGLAPHELMGRSPSPHHPHQHPPPPHPAMLAQSPRLMPPFNPAAVLMANRMLNPLLRGSPPTHVPPPGSPFHSPFGSPSAQALHRMAHGPPGFGSDPPPRPPHQPHMSGPPHQNHGYHDRGNRNHHSNGHYGHNNRHMGPVEPQREAEDPYSGLMTQKEKDWIIKIQLIQLQTDNPYLDDYYYTYHSMRKKAADRGSEDLSGQPELIIPSMMRVEPRHYTPAQFEGSLGRLTAASVHNPRQIIDVARGASPTQDDQTPSKRNVSRELRRYRQLLMDIEKGFNNILDVDDIEKKILALPPENRLALFEERREKIASVYSYFMAEENFKFKHFVPALSVRKGRKLLARLMALTDKIQSLDIVTVLLSHLPVLLKKDDDEEGLVVLLGPVTRHLGQCDLEFLVHYAAILQPPASPTPATPGLQALLKTKFGVSLLCSMLKTGEEYFSQTSPVDIDNQLKDKWSCFIEEFVEGLNVIPMEKLAVPSRKADVERHVDRFVADKKCGLVTDKLARLSSTSTSIPATS